jgi:hypothetical protein
MLAELIARQRTGGFRGIAGAAVRGRVPLREGFLNDCVKAAMADRPAGESVTVNRVSILDNNVLVVNVTVKKWLFSQTLSLELAIDPIVDVPRDPFVRLRLIRAGVLGMLAEIFGKMPPYMSLAANVCTIDLRKALLHFGAAEVTPFLQYIGITTTSGVVSLEFRLAVRPDAPPISLP